MARLKLRSVLIYGAAILLALYTLVPIVWVLLTSLKTEQETLAFPPRILPNSLNFDNYTKTIIEGDYRYYAQNSLFIGVGGTLLVMVLAIASGYAYSSSSAIALRTR